MKKTSAAIVLAIAWILGMTCLYYWGHKPFDLQRAVTLGKALLDPVLAGLVILLAGGIGRRLMGLLSNEQPDRPADMMKVRDGEKAVLQAAAGLGVLSLLWLLLGTVGLYYRLTGWIILLGGCVIFRSDSLQWLKSLSAFSVYWQNGRRFDRFLILFLIFMFALQVIWAAAPPVKYDALTYHLQLPRQYLAEHRFYFVAGNPYWGHPQLGEMLFTWMMLLQRAETAAMMGMSWGALTILGVMASVSRLLLPGSFADQAATHRQGSALRAGLAAATAIVCGTTFRDLCGWAYVDLLSALMGWGALAAVLYIFEEKPVKWLVWTAIFCGFAIGTKWTSGIAAAAILPVILFAKNKIEISWKRMILAVGVLVLMVSPWLIKNLLAAGNPLYPYFFPAQQVSEQRLYAANLTNSSVTPLQGALFPLTSTIFGWDSAAGFGSDLGPLLVLLALPGLWAFRRKPAGWFISAGLLFCWAVILAGSLSVNHLQQTRLYYVLLPWAGVAAGLGWDALAGIRQKYLKLENLLAAFFILAIIFSSIPELNRLIDLNPLQAVFDSNTRSEYISRATGWYYPAVDALYDLPEGSKVLMLWEARGFYAPLDSAADLWIDRWRMDYWTYHTADAILQEWVSQGYTHVLFCKTGAEMIRTDDTVLEAAGWQELDRLLEQLPEPQNFGNTYELYTLARTK